VVFVQPDRALDSGRLSRRRRLGPFDEQTLEFPSAVAIGQILVGLVLAGMLIAMATAFRSSSRRGWWTVAAAVVLLVGSGVAVTAVTEQAGRQAHDCARGWQRDVVEIGASWSIRCVDENFQPQGDVGRARNHQRYELVRDSGIYTVAR
jgi:hypothetical protein